MQFRIKICGVRTLHDIHMVAAMGGDAVGINFHPSSARFVDPRDAVTIAGEAKLFSLVRVGVFVHHNADEIAAIAQQVDLDIIQLHGDQTIADLDAIRAKTSLPVLRAVKLPMSELSIGEIESATKPWIESKCEILLDADAGAAHGGCGLQLDWAAIGKWHMRRGVDFALAGGIGPDNVIEAISMSSAAAVDVASGAESPHGVKNEALVRSLCVAAQSALGSPPRHN